MILPLVKSETNLDMVAVLQRKMARARALHKELIRILDAEYIAGTANDLKSLNKFILRKRNCVNRFKALVNAINEQLQIMVNRPVLSTMPWTLANLVKLIPDLTQEQIDVLYPLAEDLEKGHDVLMHCAHRNGQLFKNLLNRLHAVNSYAKHKGAVES